MELTKILDDHIAKDPDERRNYIGASAIGKECSRAIWYEYHGYQKTISAPLRRSFAIGHALEYMILERMRLAGIILLSHPQKKLDKPDYFDGHCDAVWVKPDGSKSIIEIKTARNASFNIFKSKGLQSWNQGYYAQVQVYMGFYEIDNAYVLAINKDTSELWDEKIMFRPEVFDALCQKAKMIHESVDIPCGVSNNPMFFQCKMCMYRKECFK